MKECFFSSTFSFRKEAFSVIVEHPPSHSRSYRSIYHIVAPSFFKVTVVDFDIRHLSPKSPLVDFDFTLQTSWQMCWCSACRLLLSEMEVRHKNRNLATRLMKDVSFSSIFRFIEVLSLCIASYLLRAERKLGRKDGPTTFHTHRPVKGGPNYWRRIFENGAPSLLRWRWRDCSKGQYGMVGNAILTREEGSLARIHPPHLPPLSILFPGLSPTT